MAQRTTTRQAGELLLGSSTVAKIRKPNPKEKMESMARCLAQGSTSQARAAGATKFMRLLMRSGDSAANRDPLCHTRDVTGLLVACPRPVLLHCFRRPPATENAMTMFHPWSVCMQNSWRVGTSGELNIQRVTSRCRPLLREMDGEVGICSSLLTSSHSISLSLSTTALNRFFASPPTPRHERTRGEAPHTHTHTHATPPGFGFSLLYGELGLVPRGPEVFVSRLPSSRLLPTVFFPTTALSDRGPGINISMKHLPHAI